MMSCRPYRVVPSSRGSCAHLGSLHFRGPVFLPYSPGCSPSGPLFTQVVDIRWVRCGCRPPEPRFILGGSAPPDPQRSIRTTSTIRTGQTAHPTHSTWDLGCTWDVIFDSAELSHSLKVADRRRDRPKSGQIRSESLCDGLWAPCLIFWFWFGPALDPNPARNRRFPVGSLNVFEALLAQPSGCASPLNFNPTRLHWCSRLCGARSVYVGGLIWRVPTRRR